MDNKTLISQYVNIGMRIPEYQMNQLSTNDLKSYLRMRIISLGHVGYHNTTELLSYEYKRMDDNQKDLFVKTLKESSLEDALETLGWRANSNDFAIRLIRLWSSDKISDYIRFILRTSHSPITIIYEVLNVHGPILDNIGFVLDYFESPEAKKNFCIQYLKLLSDKTDKVMNSFNSPIIGMLYNLDSVMSKSVIKYFIMLNLTKHNGNLILDDDFFTLLNNTSDDTFKEISDFMKRYLLLRPNQLDYIEKEKNNG